MRRPPLLPPPGATRCSVSPLSAGPLLLACCLTAAIGCDTSPPPPAPAPRPLTAEERFENFMAALNRQIDSRGVRTDATLADQESGG